VSIKLSVLLSIDIIEDSFVALFTHAVDYTEEIMWFARVSNLLSQISTDHRPTSVRADAVSILTINWGTNGNSINSVVNSRRVQPLHNKSDKYGSATKLHRMQTFWLDEALLASDRRYHLSRKLSTNTVLKR
jgi:hypothetical protein